MGRSAHPYDDTAVIDSRAPRTNQAVIGSLAMLAFVFNAQWLIALLAIQFILGLTMGRRWCLPCLLYFEVIQPRIGEGRIEDSRPPRFANQVGAVFLSVATISFLAGADAFGWVLALIVSTLALFSAMSGICLGCEAYVAIAKARGMRLDRYPV
jgi:hypothetical protein